MYQYILISNYVLKWWHYFISITKKKQIDIFSYYLSSGLCNEIHYVIYLKYCAVIMEQGYNLTYDFTHRFIIIKKMKQIQ